MSDDVAISIGSLWRARDGRLLKVVAMSGPIQTGFGVRYPISCSVLNATHGTRKSTTLDASNFGPGRFLQAEPHA